MLSRSRNEPSLLDIVLKGRWPAAAWTALVCFLFAFAVLPSLAKNPITAVISAAQPIAALTGLLFAVIALAKFLRGRIEPRSTPHATTKWRTPPAVEGAQEKNAR